MPDNTNHPINVKVWPQIRLRQSTYDLLHVLSDEHERTMVDIVNEAVKAWSRKHADSGSGIREMVELELFLRQLRMLLLDPNNSTWQEIAVFLVPRAAVITQSHAFIRGMLHGL